MKGRIVLIVDDIDISRQGTALIVESIGFDTDEAWANERQEDAYDRLEKRLANIENRFGGLIVKAVKMSAQSLYLTSVGLQYGHQRQEKKYRSSFAAKR